MGCVASTSKCGDANGVQSDIGSAKLAKASSTSDVCETIGDSAIFCRHATSGVKTANRMKTSTTNFACVAAADKCGDSDGVQSANTGMKAKTSTDNDQCVTIGSNVKNCRHATTGIKVVDGAILTSTTDALCVTDATKCAHATTGVTTANTLKVARVSATDASCETIGDSAIFCRHATTGVKTANRMKTSATEFLCVADAAKCGD